MVETIVNSLVCLINEQIDEGNFSTTIARKENSKEKLFENNESLYYSFYHTQTSICSTN